MGDDQGTRAPWWLWLGWGLSQAVATGAVATCTTFAALFLVPHAFGVRDGQGAAGLAALVLLASGAVALVAGILGLVLAYRLRGRGARWVPRAAWGLLALGVVLGLVPSLAG